MDFQKLYSTVYMSNGGLSTKTLAIVCMYCYFIWNPNHDFPAQNKYYKIGRIEIKKPPKFGGLFFIKSAGAKKAFAKPFQ